MKERDGETESLSFNDVLEEEDETIVYLYEWELLLCGECKVEVTRQLQGVVVLEPLHDVLPGLLVHHVRLDLKVDGLDSGWTSSLDG